MIEFCIVLIRDRSCESELIGAFEAEEPSVTGVHRQSRFGTS
jgi:hypothetical protein